ncbi:type II 3-dehydroquinate dehydratase [Phaeocystidibacter luteus]|uniref:3-dehydroquinate dehydratase n=1 Tax=Phaeocystidibacter luteus TaxID=911197 RepID=A0A6N6RMD1_9FLAO|nr:type II 3-dehydroquinate dehydratase [Phaeocystidibacter luteus]KAB2814726.1 type II 3-dehydroquinate dehydratase [Phaeocystidibacter luteus]
MKIQIINGPNLNLLGRREPEIYGNESFVTFFERLRMRYPEVDLSYFQSNSEGELVSQIQRAGFEADFIILNGAGYTHTSVAMADAIALIPAPVVEVHISNIYAREEFRQHSLTAHNCVGVITGLGLEGYSLAIDYCLRSDK